MSDVKRWIGEVISACATALSAENERLEALLDELRDAIAKSHGEEQRLRAEMESLRAQLADAETSLHIHDVASADYWFRYGNIKD